ncbi:MAG: T9SS type A sorting domain-containing protein [Flavobacteriales bacterium]|nr:T9SS type A sorting domain-containing protein [Flavobacteriales bacterium]
MKAKFTISIIACSLFSITAFTQTGIPGIDYRACSAAERNNEISENNLTIKALAEQQNQHALDWTKKFYGKSSIDPVTGKKTILYVIPVVWHVIHNGGPENISKATIESEIAKLNEDYQKLNADIVNAHALFAGITADIQVEFRLARKDPNGNCTEGITRTKNAITYAMDESAKTIRPSWNSSTHTYLNIWQGSAIASGAGGYAFYPGYVPNNREGVVLIAGQLGNTVTHEVGHYLNLKHCWGDSNTPGDPNNCNIDDDVTDTPNTIGQTGCSETSQSCNSIDNVQNYMEYNFCDVMFTEGQKQRMHAALNSGVGKRSSLWSAANRTNTGTDDPYNQNPVCLLQGADFVYNKSKICEGDSVTFNDINTYNGTPTLWSWTFAGGTPSSSTLQTPVITYNTAGVYGATYSPGNGAGYATQASKSNIITVSTLTAQYTLPFAESFENVSQFNADWKIETQNGSGWTNSTNAAYTGSRAMRVNNVSNSTNDITELISPSYNLSTYTAPKLNWKAAYAKKIAGGNDILTIYSSIDCGTSWQIATVKTASSMSSAPATDASFTPSGASQWKDNTYTISAALASKTNVRFKFHFKSNGGNNMYLDDINIFGDNPTAVPEVKNISNFIVYPNPTNESANISFVLNSDVKKLKISVKDVLGKEVTTVINGQSLTAGKYNMSIDQGKKLSTGMYFIEFNADNKIKIEKLIVK